MPRAQKPKDFAWAVKELKAGRSVARTGWNGRGMALVLIPGSTFKVDKDRPLARHFPPGMEMSYHAHIDMMSAQGYLVPWLASQADLLSEDWVSAMPASQLAQIRAAQAALSPSPAPDTPATPSKPSKVAKAIKRIERAADKPNLPPKKRVTSSEAIKERHLPAKPRRGAKPVANGKGAV